MMHVAHTIKTSHQKKTALTKINGTPLLKWITALCVLDSVGADEDCYTGEGEDYRGDQSRTKSGYTCQKWSSQSPHTHVYTPGYMNPCAGDGCWLEDAGIGDHNYCRNPSNHEGGPWCYTTSANGYWDPSAHWGECAVGKCKKKGSCMSGNTGTFKATIENSTGGLERTVAIVKELVVGDTIQGLDADKQPALCTVEAVGSFGHGPLYGNYTEDHFVLDPATGNVTQHGAVGNRTVEDRYDVITSCPVGLDEAGTGFTPMDGDFCGKTTSEMGWSDYLLIHASMLRIVRATGAYWFSASAYRDFASVAQHGPELCAAMLACAGAGAECNELERISALFINSDYLTDDARNATMKGMPGLGEVGTPGSVSFVVSQGKARSTEHRVLIAAGAVAGAAMISLLLVVTVVAHSVVRRKRSSPTPTTVELTPGTLKLDQAAAPEIATA